MSYDCKDPVDELIGIVETYNDSIEKWGKNRPGIRPTIYKEGNGKLTIDRVTKTLFEKKYEKSNAKEPTAYCDSEG